MLIEKTWQLAHNSNRGMLCIGCIEQRIGRKLNPLDFKDCHVNRINPGESKSQRLVDRLGY